jgi:hypothetical protein
MFPGSLTLGDWRIRGDESGAFYLEVFDDSGAVVTNSWYPVCTWGFNTQNNSPSLTVGGVDVVQSLSNREPLFTAVDPVYKNLDLLTGAYELRVHSPFWIAGKVLGTQSSPTVVASKGRTGFSVTRRNNATGQYIITFDSDHPDGADYTILLTQQGTGNIKVQQFAGITPRAAGFDIVCYDTAFAPANFDFYVAVLR